MPTPGPTLPGHNVHWPDSAPHQITRFPSHSQNIFIKVSIVNGNIADLSLVLFRPDVVWCDYVGQMLTICLSCPNHYYYLTFILSQISSCLYLVLSALQWITFFPVLFSQNITTRPGSMGTQQVNRPSQYARRERKRDLHFSKNSPTCI